MEDGGKFTIGTNEKGRHGYGQYRYKSTGWVEAGKDRPAEAEGEKVPEVKRGEHGGNDMGAA
jgi:hypothetical protein